MLPWLEERGIELVRGRAALDGERTRASSATSASTARQAVVIATGTTAAIPPIDGLAEAAPVDQPRGDDGEARSRSGC